MSLLYYKEGGKIRITICILEAPGEIEDQVPIVMQWTHKRECLSQKAHSFNEQGRKRMSESRIHPRWGTKAQKTYGFLIVMQGVSSYAGIWAHLTNITV